MKEDLSKRKFIVPLLCVGHYISYVLSCPSPCFPFSQRRKLRFTKISSFPKAIQQRAGTKYSSSDLPNTRKIILEYLLEIFLTIILAWGERLDTVSWPFQLSDKPSANQPSQNDDLRTAYAPNHLLTKW